MAELARVYFTKKSVVARGQFAVANVRVVPNSDQNQKEVETSVFRAYIQLTNMHHHRRQQWWAWLHVQVNNNMPFARGSCERNVSSEAALKHKV